MASSAVENDADSVDSIVLDDGPNPLKPATPGATGPRTFMSAIQHRDGPETPAASSAALSASQPSRRLEGASAELGKATGGVGDEGGDAAIAPHGTIATPEQVAPPAEPRAATPAHDADVLALLQNDVPRFLGRPGPLLTPVRCYIVREKGAGGVLRKGGHLYRLYHEPSDAFLLSARKRTRTASPSYLVSLDEFVASRMASSYFGKINSNFIGTEFVAYDRGERSLKKAQQRAASARFVPALAPEAAPSVSEAGSGGSDGGAVSARSERVVVQYHMNVLGTKGPRKMTIGIPYVDFDTNEAVVWSGTSAQDGMLASLKNTSDERMIRLVNKVPKWNANLGAYCLNFNGRVTQASVKNFQLVSEGDSQDRDVLQFGRVGEHKFTMDYCWPLTAFQAFCVCITSLDSKLACE